MAFRALQRPSTAGLAATYNAASGGGDTFDAGDHVVLHVKNGSAGTVTATVVTPNTVHGLALADAAVSIPAGGDRFIGPLPRDPFAGTDGLVSVTWSSATSVTFAAIAI